MSAPDRIWLQDAGDYAAAAEFEVTWCVDPQNDGDTEYVRADIAADLLAALEMALEFVEHHSSRWDGSTSHPATVADTARAAIVRVAIARGAA